MHPVVARATRTPLAETAGEAYGYPSGPGAVRGQLPPELQQSEAWGDRITVVQTTRAVSPLTVAGQPVANLDHPVGAVRPPNNRGAAMPGRFGGVAPWAVDDNGGAHSIIIRLRRVTAPPTEPWGVSAGLLRVPPPDVANGEGCGSYGTVAYAPNPAEESWGA